MFNELQRKKLIVPFTLVGGSDFVAADTPGIMASFIVPYNCKLTAVQCSIAASGGTGPTLTVSVKRGATTLVTNSAASVANTVARTSGLSVTLNAGESIDLNTAVANTDNTFQGVVVILEVQIMLEG